MIKILLALIAAVLLVFYLSLGIAVTATVVGGLTQILQENDWTTGTTMDSKNNLSYSRVEEKKNLDVIYYEAMKIKLRIELLRYSRPWYQDESGMRIESYIETDVVWGFPDWVRYEESGWSQEWGLYRERKQKNKLRIAVSTKYYTVVFVVGDFCYLCVHAPA